MENQKVIEAQIMAFIKPILFTVLGVIIALFLFRGCNSPQFQQVNLQPIKDTLIKKFMQKDKEAILAHQKANEYKLIADSLTKLKSKVITRYVALKNKAKIDYQKDTVINQIVANCDSLNDINSNIIFAKDSTIENLEKVVFAKDYQIENLKTQMQLNTAEFEAQKELIKSQNKNLKKQKFKTFLVGLIGASTTVVAIYLSK
jgi:hypothetical protein